MPIPPLHQRILHSCVNGVTFKQSNRNCKAVKDVKHCNSHKSGDVEPNSNIQVSLSSFKNGGNKVPAKDYPHNSNSNVKRPFQFSVFFRTGEAQR